MGAAQRSEMPTKPIAPVPRVLPTRAESIALVFEGEHDQMKLKKKRRG
jgi:hypothetical protein